MRDAFQGEVRNGQFFRIDYVLAAAQWILWYGQTLFMRISGGPEMCDDRKDEWRPGDRYKGGPELSLEWWHFWKERFRAVAAEPAKESLEKSVAGCRAM